MSPSSSGLLSPAAADPSYPWLSAVGITCVLDLKRPLGTLGPLANDLQA